jgi:UDP-N-acetylmuramate--alanine ligase
MTQKYHFIGIGGIGMSGLARLLLSRNIPVSGSDLAITNTVESLIQEGAVIRKGHAPENIPPQSIVVYTSDIRDDNPEFQAAIQRKLPMLHRSDLLATLLEGHKALAVAGTHGKTSTTALLASVLIHAGLDPSFAVGGIVSGIRSNAKLGKGEFFPFEADESDRSFLKFHPFGAIVTNIDQDHLCAYNGRFVELVDAFKIFASQVKSSKHFFWCCDDPNLQELGLKGQSYGWSEKSDWKLIGFQQKGFSSYFDLEHEGSDYTQIKLALSGKHNVLNAAGVFGLALTLGIPESKVREAFENFQGVQRRCERKGEMSGVEFWDDYAHHPVEIKATLKGIKEAIYPRRLIAVFQPHRYSRTKNCIGQYGMIFDDADEVIVTDIYAAGEQPISGISHSLIVDEVNSHSTVPCRYVCRSALNHYLSEFVRPYDTVVTLGAGDITKLGLGIISLLEKS